MSFIAECVKDSMPVWEECLRGDFLTEMEKGTLSMDAFNGYIVDDSLYLREYAKVFAASIVKSRTWEEIRTYYSFLSFVNEGEGCTRVDYLKKIGLDDRRIEHLPQRPENRAYTQFMINTVLNGNSGAECMMAVMPCMLSYAWIFHTMEDRSPQLRDTYFWPLISDYTAPSYDDACRRWSAFTDRLCEHLTPEQKKRCMEIFHESSVHELHFWEMSFRSRNDLPIENEKP